MKNRLNYLAAFLIGAALLTACNTLEVTLPVGPQGEQGIQGVAGKDGLSAYEIWVKSINDKTITDWTGGTAINDFFIYLKGKDGRDGRDGVDGKDGIDGKDGKDGIDGKSALELWREYVASGVEDPKHPGTMWDKDKISERDFYEFLTGADGRDGRDGRDGVDGKDGQDGQDGLDGLDGNDGADGQGGLSAYELWVADVISEEGLDNPGNGVYDIDEYPKWPRDAVSIEDFYRYLMGKDGKDGESGGESHEEDDPIYSERVDGQKYNVAPVIAMSRSKDGSEKYEYVNPFSGGAAFIVTGPGPVIIPDCEVTFTTMDGSITYTKTSDGSGYVYLTRAELPEWSDGAPSAEDDPSDLASGVRPLSFSFGGKTIKDPSRIAATCKVPYRVDLELSIISGSLKGSNSSVRYEVRRIVEGQPEEDAFILSGQNSYVNDYRGNGFLHSVPAIYKYYRNQGAVKRLRDIYEAYSVIASGLPQASSSDDEMMSFFTTVANLSEPEVPGFRRIVDEEYYSSPSFGNGNEPSVVDVYESFLSVNKGTLVMKRMKPDYGLEIDDETRSVHVPSITKLPDILKRASYVWKSGHTTLTFELDWGAIDKLPVANGYSGRWEGNEYVYDYVAFGNLQSRPTSVFSSFSAKGRFNGSVIDSKVRIGWQKPIVFTDIYDDFSVSIADVESGFVLFEGLEGTFYYDASDDDENGNGCAYMFGQTIPKTEEKAGF